MRYFTQYWKNATWDERAGEPLTHLSSSEFAPRGVTVGDAIHVVTVRDGQLQLGARLVVTQLLDQRAAERQLGRRLESARDHALAAKPQPFPRDLIVPMDLVRQLRFVSGRPLQFRSAGRLDSRSLQGVRELMPESAERLAQLLREADARTTTGPGARDVATPATALPVGAEYFDPRAAREAREEQCLQAIRARPDLDAASKQSLVQARQGRGVYRAQVEQFESMCRVTGVGDRRHLLACHIKPWVDCTDAEQLDGHNGLLLSPHVAHLFEQGHLAFADDGRLLLAPEMNLGVLRRWAIDKASPAKAFLPEQKRYLDWHRVYVFAQPERGRRRAGRAR